MAESRGTPTSLLAEWRERTVEQQLAHVQAELHATREDRDRLFNELLNVRRELASLRRDVQKRAQTGTNKP